MGYRCDPISSVLDHVGVTVAGATLPCHAGRLLPIPRRIVWKPYMADNLRGSRVDLCLGMHDIH
jgi:hypothetical protein